MFCHVPLFHKESIKAKKPKGFGESDGKGLPTIGRDNNITYIRFTKVTYALSLTQLGIFVSLSLPTNTTTLFLFLSLGF